MIKINVIINNKMPARNVKMYASKLINDSISINTNSYELNPDLVASINYSTSLGAGSFGIVYPG